MSVQVGADPSRFENEEFAREQYRKLERQEQDKRETLAESYSLQERIERQLAEESIDVPIGDEMVGFRPLGREASEFVSVIQDRWEALDEDEDDVYDEFRRDVDLMYATVAEHAQPEFVTMDWVEERFSIPRVIAILHYVNVEGKPLDKSETKK